MKRKLLSFLLLFYLSTTLQAQSLLNGYEYWVDDNYVAKTVQSFAPVASYHLTTGASLNTIQFGLHEFNIRFSTVNGAYSNTVTRYFYRSSSNIAAYEYWFDTNYAGRTLTAVTPAQQVNLTTALNVNAISPGAHLFNIRFITSDGGYSNVISRYYLNASSRIAGYEYWVDNNYSAHTFQSQTPAQLINVSAAVNVNSLGVGPHLFNIRFLTTEGTYSNVITKCFFNASSSVAGYEYWFDNNYGAKVSQNTAPTPNFDLTQSLDVNSLNAGYHLFHIRFHDSNQAWSNTKSSFFVKLGQAPNGNVISAYRYWFDDGDTALVNLPVSLPSKAVHLTASLPIPQLAGANHKVNIQFRDTSQLWSGVFSQSFATCAGGNPPDSAGLISGITLVSACANQLGITYQIDTIANATNYQWTLPPLASIVGNADTNVVTVNYNAYSSSGNVTVSGSNLCGTGAASSLPIHFKSIPVTEICRATIDSVSQKSKIEWQKPTETYVTGYVVFRDSAGTFIKIDTVPNTAFSAYLDTGSHPNLQAEKYKIAVLDSCGNIGDISVPFEHQTIRLNGSIQAGGVAKLYWNDYTGITDPQRYFNLLRDPSGNGPFNDTIAKNIMPSASMIATDLGSAAYPLCRYVIEMVYNSNCTPSQRTQASRSTSRSNIKNKTALFDSSSVNILQLKYENELATIFPNPANSFVKISFSQPVKKCDIQLKDMLGKLIFSKSFNNFESKQEFQLEIQNIQTGVYFMEVNTDKRFSIFKLVKTTK